MGGGSLQKKRNKIPQMVACSVNYAKLGYMADDSMASGFSGFVAPAQS